MKFKVGDLVRCIDSNKNYTFGNKVINVGELYKVVKYDGMYDTIFYVDEDNWYSDDRFELVKVTHYSFEV
jgi:hypothetical protein